MKRVINFLVSGAIVLSTQPASAQSDESRMNRDVEIAENVLSTLIKQELNARNFFPIEIQGSYRAGYGVTFTVPTNMLMPMVWGGGNDIMVLDGTPGVYSYSFSTAPEPGEVAIIERDVAEAERAKAEKEIAKAEKEMKSAKKEMEKAEKVARAENEYLRGASGGVRVTRSSRNEDRDSLQAVSNAKIIQAAKNFLADYGDMLSQLKADERVIITNQGNNQRWAYYGQNAKRSVLVVEALKGDLTQYRQGKITRDQLLSKIKVTNTESSGKREADLEVLSSAFNRLYSSDLSDNFFTEGNIYYEKLAGYGAVMYMQVYSSNQDNERDLFNMPTLDLRGVSQAERDKKVKELYPTFESELKENILEYGTMVKSLKDNESLVFNVTLTKCKGCGIPADIEVSVLYSVLKDYGSGKVDKNNALGKVVVKKGITQ